MDLAPKVASALLEARQVGFSFGARAVLTGVSFSLRSGEIVALLGRNGVGKTTLLRLLLGLERPVEGEVFLDGTPIRHLRRREIARSIAYIPQSHVPVFPYRVCEVVRLGRTPSAGLFRSLRREDHEAADRALAQVGLSRLGERLYTELSGGEIQLVLIARALAQGSRLLVMDEPFAGVDYGHQQRLVACLQDLACTGVGIVLTTHDPEQALRVSTRAALLVDGRIRDDGPPERVLTKEAIFSLYGVKVEVLRSAEGLAALCPVRGQSKSAEAIRQASSQAC